MITVKDGVDLSGIDRRMWNAVAVVEECFGGDVTITSGREGQHGVASWHYVGRALDFRWPETDGRDEASWRAARRLEVLEAVGSRFEGIAHKTHLHLELERG